jgi:hypothetical protein
MKYFRAKFEVQPRQFRIYLRIEWPLLGVKRNTVKRVNPKDKRGSKDSSSSKHLCVVDLTWLLILSSVELHKQGNRGTDLNLLQNLCNTS